MQRVVRLGVLGLRPLVSWTLCCFAWGDYPEGVKGGHDRVGDDIRDLLWTRRHYGCLLLKEYSPQLRTSDNHVRVPDGLDTLHRVATTLVRLRVGVARALSHSHHPS